MKLRFNTATINTPLGYATFVYDLNQRQLTNVFEACEAAKDNRLVYDALREWVSTSDQFASFPPPALAALCKALAGQRPTGGPTKAQARDAALRASAVALCWRYPGLTPTRNVCNVATPSAASLLAEVVGRSEERINKVLRGVLALCKK